jgi:hypothetical protein
MPKRWFDPLTYQFYYRCPPEVRLAQTPPVLIGTRSAADEIALQPCSPKHIGNIVEKPPNMKEEAMGEDDDRC